jgi:hypothetical protein
MRRQRGPKYSARVSEAVTDAVILGHKDWRRIKTGSKHYTTAEQMERYQDDDRRRKTAVHAVKARRETILECERERQE